MENRIEQTYKIFLKNILAESLIITNLFIKENNKNLELSLLDYWPKEGKKKEKEKRLLLAHK